MEKPIQIIPRTLTWNYRELTEKGVEGSTPMELLGVSQEQVDEAKNDITAQSKLLLKSEGDINPFKEKDNSPIFTELQRAIACLEVFTESKNCGLLAGMVLQATTDFEFSDNPTNIEAAEAATYAVDQFSDHLLAHLLLFTMESKASANPMVAMLKAMARMKEDQESEA